MKKYTLYTLFIVLLFSFSTHLVDAETAIHWNSIGPGGGGRITGITIDPKNEKIVYVYTDVSGVFKSTNGGAHFRSINTGLKNLAIQNLVIDPNHSNILYLGTRASGIYRSTDGGSHWVKKSKGLIPSGAQLSYPIKALAIDPQHPKTLYAAYGEVLGNDHVIHSTGYKKYSRGNIYKSTNRGKTWHMVSTGAHQIKTPAYVYELAVNPKKSKKIYATTETGFYVSSDGGVNWKKQSHGLPSKDVRGLAINPHHPDILYVTVWSKKNHWNGGVFRSSDGGHTWKKRNSGLRHRSSSNYPDVVIDPRHPHTLYTSDIAYGGDSGIQKSTNEGKTWNSLITHNKKKQSFPNIDIWKNGKTDSFGNISASSIAIAASATRTLYFGTSMAVFQTTNGGKTWIAAHTKKWNDGSWQSRGIENSCVRSIVIDPKNTETLYIGNADIGLLKSTNQGKSFTVQRSGMGKYSSDIAGITVDPKQSSLLYAAGHPDNTFTRSVVMKSSDSGEHWSIIGKKATGLPTGGGITSPIVIDPSSPTEKRTLYVAKYGSGVYKSTNGGKTWRAKNTGLPHTHRARSIVIDPKNTTILYVGFGKNGGIFKTTTGGNTWSRIDHNMMRDIYDLTIDPSDSDTVYASVKNYWNSAAHKNYPSSKIGGVFVTHDGGNSWSQILQNDTVREVAVDPTSKQRIYAVTKDDPYHDDYLAKGMYKSSNRGKDWSLMNGNLPNTNLNTITLDPKNSNKLYVGSACNGVFTALDKN